MSVERKWVLSRPVAVVLLLGLVLALLPATGFAQDADDGEDAADTVWLSGQVTDVFSGAAVAGAEVGIFVTRPGIGPSPVGLTVTGADGSYAFTGEPRGDVTHIGVTDNNVIPLPDHENLWRVFDVTGAPPYVLDLQVHPKLDPPPVTGTVVDADTGAELVGPSTIPVEGPDDRFPTLFLSYVDIEDDAVRPFIPFVAWRPTDNNTFRFHWVEEDRPFLIEAALRGYITEVFGPFTYDGDTPTEVAIELTRYGRDVPEESTHADGVDWVLRQGIAQGYEDGSFRPQLEVTREQMATFLFRALELAPADVEFDDVVAGSTHAEAIGAVAAAGISEGYGDGTFGPRDPVSREQMATFLFRALELAPVDVEFDDVVAGSTHAEAIGAIAAVRISEGYGDGTFRPTLPVTREQMATFLYRAVE